MFYRRFLAGALRSRVSRDKVRLLFGARQTGKTVLLSHLLGGEEAIVFDLGSSAVRRRFERDPAAFGRELVDVPRRVRAVVVDEIQKVPAILDEVQSFHDRSPRRLQIFLTGSSARRLRRQSSNLLPGRSHVFRLYPACRWEIDGPPRHAWAGAEPPAEGATVREPPGFPSRDLERTLLLGSLPGVRAERDETAARTLASYVENYLEEEIRREAAARDLGAFANFLRLAALESGQQVNLASLSRDCGIAVSTLKSYYDVLVDTFTGYRVEPYARRGRRRLLAAPRFLVFDTGVRNAAAELPFERGLLGVEGSRLLEQWVGLELIARASYRGRGHGVSFWRTASGAEVDWVWQGPREDVPIEVKWTARPGPTDARHIETFLDEHPDRARMGLVVCRCDRPQRLTERVTAVPWDGW